MKLQRYNPVSHNPLQWDPEMDECDDGEYYRAADVDALLARIREAVDAEREAVFRHVVARGRDSGAAMQGSLRAAAALDALLSGEG